MSDLYICYCEVYALLWIRSILFLLPQEALRMRVLVGDAAELKPELGILTGRWSQYTEMGDMPFGAMWCVIPPGGRTNTDCHPERELVVVVSGSAEVQASNRSQTAGSGDAVLLDAEEAHVLVNTSASDPFVALSLYWQPPLTAVSDAG
jgi:mannose-6-phosphate isomerase-like protein (cupin superfamily)